MLNKLYILSQKMKDYPRTLPLVLDEMHLVQTPRELAPLHLLREIVVGEPLGEFHATVAVARLFPGPRQRRRSRPLGERIRDGIRLGYVKVNRPIVFMEMRLLGEAAVRRVTTVHTRCPVAVRVRARVVYPVLVRRVS